ncbi:hypothetical protein N431DRAFT_436998 [Stipitochalara longipes BDJ]|nr:hypothetical protein N431DRAFT_436998 [Stipitochalara longipes BDJ]
MAGTSVCGDEDDNIIIDIDELQAHGGSSAVFSWARKLIMYAGINAADITKLRNNNICTIAVNH